MGRITLRLRTSRSGPKTIERHSTEWSKLKITCTEAERTLDFVIKLGGIWSELTVLGDIKTAETKIKALLIRARASVL